MTKKQQKKTLIAAKVYLKVFDHQNININHDIHCCIDSMDNAIEELVQGEHISEELFNKYADKLQKLRKSFDARLRQLDVMCHELEKIVDAT